MNVILLVTTHCDGKKLNPGDLGSVADDVGKRWVEAGIAEEMVSKTGTGEKPLERLNTKELEAKAAVLGIDISTATTNTQRKEMIQAHINAQN